MRSPEGAVSGRPLLTALVGLALFVALLRLSGNLDTAYLWFDEAGQYWIAKGLHHDSPPLSPPGGLLDVIESNRHYNRDPGGFSVLLHAWTVAGDGHVWLRTLPFSLYLCGLAVFAALMHRFSGDLRTALTAAFLPVLAGVERAMAFELRPYSYEMLGTLLALLAVPWLRDRPTAGRAFVVGAGLSVFMWSRYSAVLVMASVGLHVTWMLLSGPGPLRRRLATLVAFATPLLAGVAAIVVLSMSVQNPSAKPLFYLPYLGRDPEVLLKPRSLAYLGMLALLVVLAATARRWRGSERYRDLLGITLSVNVVFFVASVLNRHPWDPFSSRCISLHLLLLVWLGVAWVELQRRLAASRPAVAAGATGVAIAAALAVGWPRFDLPVRTDPSIYTDLRDAPLPASTRFYVDRIASPSVRYLLEQGALRDQNRFDYPKAFTFATFRRHSDWSPNGDEASIPDWYRDRPKMNALTGYDVLITPELAVFGDADQWTLRPGSHWLWTRREAPPAEAGSAR